MDAPRLTPEQKLKLKQAVQVQAEAFVEKMLMAVDGAALGRFIADSEGPVRAAVHEFGQAAFEAAMQAKVHAAEAAFPPSGEPHDPPAAPQ